MQKAKYHNLFLYRVYRQSKLLFWAMMVFIIGQGFFTWKGVDTMPFYNWGMFSGRFPDKEQYEVLYINVDGRYVPLTKLPRTKLNVLEKAIRYYLLMEENGFRDGMDGVIESRFKGRLGDEAYHFVYHRLSNTGMQKEVFANWMFRQMRWEFSDALFGGDFIEVGHFTTSYTPNGFVILDTIPRAKFEL